jgi:hypothetical protein
MIDGATLDCAGHSINFSTISGASGYGVRADAFVTGGSGSTIKNCIFNRGASTWQSNGIRIYRTYEVNIDNVTISMNLATDAGIYLTGVNAINITNSNISCSGSPCQAIGATDNVEPTSNVEIWNSTLSAIGGDVIYFSNTNNFSVFNSNLTSDSNAIRFLGGVYDTLFKNSYISGSKTIKMSAQNNYNNIFLNDTLPSFSYDLTTATNFTIRWYGRINVTNSSGSPLQALINDTDKQGQIAFVGQANANGLTGWFIVNDTKYASNGNILYNNHLINASYSGYTSNQTSFNFSRQDTTVNITLYLIDVVPPTITFISPTPNNEETVNESFLTVNISSNEALSSSILNWNGTMYLMTQESTTIWNEFLAGLGNGVYYYNVSANDTALNEGTSETRSLTINVTILPGPSTNITYDFMGFVFNDVENRKSTVFQIKNYFLAALPLIWLAFVGLWKKDWLVS